MDALYDHALEQLDKAFRRLENMVPPPQMVPCQNSFVFRYREKTIHQALIQKLARLVSGLHAASLLCEQGLLQEQSAVQRMLDEYHEDILFLVTAVISQKITPDHHRYLASFYQEEFDLNTGKSLLKRDMLPRKKIRAYLARHHYSESPSVAVEAAHAIHSTYSGYVHGASPQIMDMYGGNPPHFHIHGMAGTPRHDYHRYDLYNPFFRTIVSFAMAAKAFGEEQLFQSLNAYHLEFDRISGRNEAYRNVQSSPPPGTPQNS